MITNRNGSAEVPEESIPSAPPADGTDPSPLSPSLTHPPASSPSLSPSSSPSPATYAHEVLNWFLLSANEYQHKTENDYVVVLSINEDTLKVWAQLNNNNNKSNNTYKNQKKKDVSLYLLVGQWNSETQAPYWVSGAWQRSERRYSFWLGIFPFR